MWKRPVIVCQVHYGARARISCSSTHDRFPFDPSLGLRKESSWREKWNYRSSRFDEPLSRYVICVSTILSAGTSFDFFFFKHADAQISLRGKIHTLREIMSIGIHPQWLSHDWRKSDFAANFHSNDWLPRSRSDSLKRFISTRLPSSKNYVFATSLVRFIWSIQPSPEYMHSATDVV